MVASGKIGLDEVLRWIDKHTKPLEGKIGKEIGEFVGMLAQVSEKEA